MNKALVYASTLATLFGVAHQVIAQEALFERGKIIAPDVARGDIFGHALSLDNGKVIVSAPMADGVRFNSGSAYIIDTHTGSVLEKINPSSSGSSGLFGDSVALRGDTVLAGIPNAFGTGAVSVFDISGNNINLLQPFSPPDAGTDLSNFGYSVGMSDSGINMVVGARGDTGQSDAGSNYGGGAMYIYTGNDSVTKVFASDADVQDNFGHSVAVSEIFAVGSSPFDFVDGVQRGAIYVFDVTNATEIHKIVPADASNRDLFGWQVDIEGSVIAAGANFHDAAGPDAGAVYLFDAVSGEQLNKLTVPGTRLFGTSLDLNGDRLVVGSEGRAHVFDVNSGELLAELLPSDASGNQGFGGSVTIEGDTVVVGAQIDSNAGSNAGAIYIYDLSGELPQIQPPQDDQQGGVSVQSLEAGVFTFTNRRGVVRQGAEISLTVVNDQGQPAAGAVVTVETTGRISEVLTGTTDADGVLTLRSERTRRADRSLTYTACVFNIEGDFDYNENNNAQTCASL